MDHESHTVRGRWPQNLLPLPAELLYKIFTQLGIRELQDCQRVCKAWLLLLRNPQVPVRGKVYVSITDLSELLENIHFHPEAFSPVARC